MTTETRRSAIAKIDEGYECTLHIPDIRLEQWKIFLRRCEKKFGPENQYRVSYDSTLSRISLRRPSKFGTCIATWFLTQYNIWHDEHFKHLSPFKVIEYIVCLAGARTEGDFSGRAAESSKEPEITVQPWATRFPSLVIETGIFETTDVNIREDMELWQRHTREETNVVMGFDIYKRPEGISIKGYLWRRKTNITEEIFVFPPPASSRNRDTTRRSANAHITTEELFAGGPYPDGIVGDEKLYFNLDFCRTSVRQTMSRAGETIVSY